MLLLSLSLPVCSQTITGHSRKDFKDFQKWFWFYFMAFANSKVVEERSNQTWQHHARPFGDEVDKEDWVDEQGDLSDLEEHEEDTWRHGEQGKV